MCGVSTSSLNIVGNGFMLSMCGWKEKQLILIYFTKFETF